METSAAARIPTIKLPAGDAVPVLGQGTWKIGERARDRQQELNALQLGLDLGMRLIDTAEMYGDGGAEKLVGRAIAGRRNEVFLVSKFYPQNATRKRMIAACERSLKRLRTDRIDLYLLHWRGSVALEETLSGFQQLLRDGKICHWGVSNFDLEDRKELFALNFIPAAAVNQVLYNLARRGIEWDILPWCRDHGIPVMAYAPVEEGKLLANESLKKIASCHGASTVQAALAWLLRQPGVIAIPKAARPDHVRENRRCLEIKLTEQDLADLDAEFPPPRGPRPLEMI